MINMKLVVVIGLVLIWGTFFIFLMRYGESVRNDPCGVCSKKMGKDITCTLNGLIPVWRTYYSNGTIADTTPKVIYVPPKINITK